MTPEIKDILFIEDKYGDYTGRKMIKIYKDLGIELKECRK